MPYTSKLFCLSLLLGLVAAVLVSRAQESGSGCLNSMSSGVCGKTCETLYLLNIVPFPVPGEESWDGGYEVIPAGLLAAKHINNRSDILGGYNLEIINLNSEACGVSPVTMSIVNFYERLVNMDVDRQCIVGVVGLYCSSVTEIIAPLASIPEIDYVTLAASTSSDHRDVSKYPQLFHTIASFAVVKESVVAMMRRFNWTRIGLVNDNNGVFFYSTANAFAKKIISEPDLNLIAHLPLFKNNLNDVLRKLINAEARISFWSVSAEQAAKVLCEAYREKLVWEGYVYIFHGHTVSEILNANTTCTRDELVNGSYGIFILNYKLTNSNQSLVSGITYEQYYREFEEEVNNFARKKKTNIIVHNDWPNSLYDQVWAYALALNATVDYVNHSFDNLHLGNKSPVFANKIISELQKMRFQGASGLVQFGTQHEVQTAIDIIQVLNGTGVRIGVFDAYNKSIELLQNINPPSDEFHVDFVHIPIYLAAIVYGVQLLLFVLITFNLVAIMWCRKKPQIKAISPQLSVLMFVGCYSLCAAPVIQTILKHVIPENLVFSVLCNLECWLLFNGVNLIFATLTLRLLRIYHVFRVFRKTGKYWSDHFLFLYVILICSFQVFILIIWSGADPLVRNDTEKRRYIPSAHPPYYEAVAICVSKNIGAWFGISYIYSGLIILGVVFLAVQTRHIKKQDFKDTKKVNAFVFTVVAAIAIGTSLQILFAALPIGFEIFEFLSIWLTYFLVPFLCQVLLFLPKTLPVILPCFKRKSLNSRSPAMVLVSRTNKMMMFNFS